MGVPTTSIGFSRSTPAAADGFQIAKPQTDNGSPQQLVDFTVPNTGGAVIKTADYTLTAADCGKLIVANSASAITFTLPATVPFGQWQVRIANIGAGALSLAPGGALTLDGATAAVSVSQLQSLSVDTDGANYFSGRGIGGAGSGNATQIRGVGVSATAPTNGQVLKYDATSGLYVPATPSTDGGGGSGRGLFSSIMSAVPTIASTGLTTAWNQTGTFSAADLADGILISDVAQGTMWEGILATYPTPPFTVVGMFTIPIDQGSFTNVLMSIVDTLTGKFMMLRREGGANGSLSVWGATAPGSGGSYTSLFSKGSLFMSFFIFIKYVDDGTTIKISFSYDGQYWPASFTYSVAKASSYLGSSGFNYIGIGISPATAPTATQLMSWTQTSP